MKIDIKGHSGCDIDIIYDDDNLYVKKSSYDPGYKDRLYKQGVKQKNDICLFDGVRNPDIHEIVNNNEESYIKMDYIYAKNFIDYLDGASPVEIDDIVQKLIGYIVNEINLSENLECTRNVFLEKFDSVERNCYKNALLVDSVRTKAILEQCRNVFRLLPVSFDLPIGQCHGDLTFSNILFAPRTLYLIDYLDSFIETPIQDIVKIRQDTKYHWSTMMYQKNYDNVRLNMILNYIDTKIDAAFSEYEYYSKYYGVLQLMNILRILPYVKETRVRDFVLNILESLL